MNRHVIFGVVVALVAVLVAGGIATVAYQAGVAQGVADAGKLPVPEAGWPRAAYWHYRPFWHHGPFGFFGIVFPLLFLLIVVGVVHRLFWGPSWRWMSPHGGPVPPTFEEWHRRAHESEPPPPNSKP